MRDYGKIYSSFWSSTTSELFSDDARMLAAYLLTCPHGNILGCFRITDGYVSDDLGWDSERVSKGFSELFGKGFATRCERSKWVFICKFLAWNSIENANQGKGAAKIFELIPDSLPAKRQLATVLDESKHFPKHVLEGFRKGFERVSEGCKNPAVAVAVATAVENHPSHVGEFEESIGGKEKADDGVTAW